MPEKEAEIPPENTVDLNEKRSFKNVTVEIIDQINLYVRARETEGKIEAIVDDTNQPKKDRIVQDGLLIDETKMDALEAFFSRAGVMFIGSPWTVEDQEDFLGDVSISVADLNRALEEGKLVLSKGAGGYYSFEGLDQFVEEFVDTHFLDDKYNPEDV